MSVQLSRYRPITASAILKRMVLPVFFPRKIPRTGTNTIYMAVRKPALPASVWTSPTCCRLAAANRAMPHKNPAFQSFLSEKISVNLRGFRNSTVAESTVTASKHRVLWNVKGPIWSIPTLWATKAEPQMIVAIKRAEMPWIFSFILSPQEM